MSSGAGRAGPNRRPGRLRALELQAPGEESRAAGAELEEEVAAARGWRASGLETASCDRERRVGQRCIGAVRAGGRRCSPDREKKEAGGPGKVGGGSGTGCVSSGGGGSACACGCRRSLPVTNSRAGLGKAAGRQSSPPLAPPARGAAGAPLAASALRAPGHLLAPVSPVLFRAGSARRRAHPFPELQAISGFPPPLRHRTLLRVPTVALVQCPGALHQRRVY